MILNFFPDHFGPFIFWYHFESLYLEPFLRFLLVISHTDSFTNSPYNPFPLILSISDIIPILVGEIIPLSI